MKPQSNKVKPPGIKDKNSNSSTTVPEILTIVINTTLNPEISAHSIKLPSDYKGNQTKLNCTNSDYEFKIQIWRMISGFLGQVPKHFNPSCHL